MRAKLIAIEGIDQAGKKTQTNLLSRQLKKRGFRVNTITFPIYKSTSGLAIKSFLSGKRDYQFRPMCILYSLNRWEHLEMITRLRESSDFLVANRYLPSALAYGMAGGLDEKFLSALDQGLPVPDDVIVLDVPVSSSFERKTKDRDVYESNSTYLRQVRQAYLRLAKRHHWKVVDGENSVEVVRLSVMQHLRLD